MFTKDDYDKDTSNLKDGALEAAEVRWNIILDKIIVGFEAHARADCGVYSEELGPYDGSDERFAVSEVLRKRDEALFQEGAQLFVKYFGCLWD